MLFEYRTERGWEQMRVEKQARDPRRAAVTVASEIHAARPGAVAGSKACAGSGAGSVQSRERRATSHRWQWTRAKLDQFEAAMARWKLPTENIVYADRDGNIGEHSTGLTPLRKSWTGLLPVPGAGGYEWSGFVPVNELPHSFNPDRGFVATANHKMIPEGYPFKIGFEWANTYRVDRIREVLHAAHGGKKLDVEDMQRLQSDAVSLPGRELVGYSGGRWTIIRMRLSNCC